MSKDIRALAIRWMEDNWNERREAVIDELMHPDCFGRIEGGGELKGREEWRQAREQLLTAFPDLSLRVDRSVVEGDTVVLLWTAKGTHRGDAMGLPPTGRTFEAVGSTWMKFEGGKMVWGYDTWNMGAMMATLAPEWTPP